MDRNSEKYKSLLRWVLVFLSFIFLVYLLFQFSSGNNSLSKEREVEKIIEAVGKLIVLPDETPTVATVSDLEKLKGQIFFKNAKVGDKVLIYIKAEKAILYDPELNKIIELAPINTNNDLTIKN